MEVFQVKAKVRRRLKNCKRRIQRRLRKKQWPEQSQRMFRDGTPPYEVGNKAQGLHGGGPGAVHLLVQPLDLADAIGRDLHLLQRHVPPFESDHVSNPAYHLLPGGPCLQDLDRLRNNEIYLKVLGAQRIPDPTTAGDFLGRFDAADIDTRRDVLNQKRVQVWQQQPDRFLEHALIEATAPWGGRRGSASRAWTGR